MLHNLGKGFRQNFTGFPPDLPKGKRGQNL